jgi:hypothetical protein
VPHLITGKYLNSFTLLNLQGNPLKGLFNIRRLRPYTPLRRTTLDLIFPHDLTEPTKYDIATAKAEECMADDLDNTIDEDSG